MTATPDEKKYAAWNRISGRYFKMALKYLLVHLARSWMVPPQLRIVLLKMCGHRFSTGGNIFIGADVLFDNVFEARTHVGCNVTIATGTKIMNHFLEPGEGNDVYAVGDVHLEDGVFLGMNVLVVKPVRIGRNTAVAAGSIVTTDLPPNAVAAGIPAKVIRLRSERETPPAS